MEDSICLSPSLCSNNVLRRRAYSVTYIRNIPGPRYLAQPCRAV